MWLPAVLCIVTESQLFQERDTRQRCVWLRLQVPANTRRRNLLSDEHGGCSYGVATVHRMLGDDQPPAWRIVAVPQPTTLELYCSRLPLVPRQVYRGKLGHEAAAIKVLGGTALCGSERERFLREAAILKNCRWACWKVGWGSGWRWAGNP